MAGYIKRLSSLSSPNQIISPVFYEQWTIAAEIRHIEAGAAYLSLQRKTAAAAAAAAAAAGVRKSKHGVEICGIIGYGGESSGEISLSLSPNSSDVLPPSFWPWSTPPPRRKRPRWQPRAACESGQGGGSSSYGFRSPSLGVNSSHCCLKYRNYTKPQSFADYLLIGCTEYLLYKFILIYSDSRLSKNLCTGYSWYNKLNPSVS